MVTVTFNAAAWLPGFLASIRDMRRTSNHSIHVIAVDNNSIDNSRELLRAANEDLDFISNSSNLGFAVASNQGIRTALEHGSDYILLLNNDTLPPPDLVDRLIATAEQMKVDFVSATLVAMDDTAETSYCGAQINRKKGFRVVPQKFPMAKGPFLTGYAPAAALLVTASTFERIGLLDERIFVYADDLDLMIRATRVGLQVAVDPSAVVPHATGSSTGGPQSEFTVRWASYGRAVVLATHTRGLERILQALYLIGWTVACLITGRTSPSASLVRLVALRRGWQVGRTIAPRTGLRREKCNQDSEMR